MTQLDLRIRPLGLVASVMLVLSGCASNRVTPSNWAGQLPELERAAARSPQDVDAWTQYGIAADLAGETEVAIDALGHAIELSPGSPEAGLPLARLLIDAGRLDRAEATMASLEPRNEADAELLRSARMRLDRARLVEQMRELARREASLDGRLPEGESIGVLDFQVAGASSVDASNEAGEGASNADASNETVGGASRVDASNGAVGGESRRASNEPDDGGSGSVSTLGTSRYVGLGKALTAVVTTELSRLRDVRVLERQNLQVLVDELDLVESQRARKPEQPSLDPVESLRGVQQRLALLRPDPSAAPFYQAEIDGRPGPGTESAVRSFQAHRGLSPDGIPGPRTQSELEDAIAQLYQSPSSSPLREPALRSAPRAGRLLGARHLLGGELAVVGDRDIEVRSRTLDARDGALVSEADLTVALDEFHRVPGRIVLTAADDLSIPLDDSERRRLEDLPPVTRSLSAFLAFGRGLEYEDRGLWREAASEYENAVRLAPEFDLARERVEVVRIGSASFEQSLQRTVRSVNATVRASSRAVEEALGAVGTGTKEGSSRDDGEDGSRAVQTDGSLPVGTVVVNGQIPVGR
ncbi:MAG: peptidoglycan-binding protein [Candidatus Eisenbacteria bacterium]|uniref:Peptidoglycan-binding protein n=1 Tax=Eiseniibacteriota bacterium TaxID=2212470 RepID=A0A956SDK8_UNCEI|nr:peptidoglycan-binding protein [Candidatus Eisenbacteria bacterium]MCB9466242.1 peptidoglycan-binding protein [Candidatus Eisenbacteria bacterium]